MWTGLSYSDAEAFNIGDYKKERSGKTSRSERYVYVGERIKTGVAYVSMLLPPAVAVLKKYDMKTPQIENHLYNRMLKAIGQIAGIKTRLHSHLARHSFATYMLSNGVPIEHVSKMVGHTNITQTQRYAKVLAEDVNAQYEKVAKKLKKSDR
jgi:site-specific recombinase XerD